MLCVVIVKEAQKRSKKININNFIIFENFVKNSNNTKIINSLLKENLQSLLSLRILINSLEYLCLYIVKLIYLMLDKTRRFNLRNIAM